MTALRLRLNEAVKRRRTARVNFFKQNRIFFEETKKSVLQGSGILAEDDLDWCKSSAKSKFGFDLGPLLAVFALSGKSFAKLEVFTSFPQF